MADIIKLKGASPSMNSDQIGAFMHCALCLKERPSNQSPLEWARLSVGWTPVGLQVWCVRHDCNVLHVDFEGQKHPADMTRKG
jgi:hypothetical protein